MSEENVNNAVNTAIDYAILYGPKLLLALLVLIIGWMLVKYIVKTIDKIMVKRDVDPSLRPFLKSLISAVLKIMLLITVVQMVGVETTSFVAILGAAGLAVGLALSGTLQNFAGGVIILILKPFKVGDWIDAQGYSGTVDNIQIFNTFLKTPDNKTVIIPNGPLSTGAMVNYSTEENRRVDFVFGIGYGDDIDKARSIIEKMVAADSRIFKDPAPQIVVAELANSSVNFKVRLWAKAADYWDIFFDYTENVKKAFDAEDINIPFPQMDVHVHNS